MWYYPIITTYPLTPNLFLTTSVIFHRDKNKTSNPALASCSINHTNKMQQCWWYATLKLCIPSAWLAPNLLGEGGHSGGQYDLHGLTSRPSLFTWGTGGRISFKWLLSQGRLKNYQTSYVRLHTVCAQEQEIENKLSLFFVVIAVY